MTENGIREQIARLLCKQDGWNWEDLQDVANQYYDAKVESDYLRDADAILAIPAIAIVDREAELPKNPYPESVFPGMSITELQQVAEACKAAVIPLGRLSGSWGRQVWDNCLSGSGMLLCLDVESLMSTYLRMNAQMSCRF